VVNNPLIATILKLENKNMSINILDFMYGNKDEQDWQVRIWREREERHYTGFFGALPETVFPVPQSALMAILPKGTLLKEHWSRHAVIEFEPNAKHNDYIYATTGLSQPFNLENEAELDPNGVSGLGFEMVLRAPERAGWAVDILHRLTAYQIGVSEGLMRGNRFKYSDWMPLNGPISPDVPETLLKGIFVTRPQDYQPVFGLPGGKVEMLQLVGISGSELAYLFAVGADKLEADLYDTGAAPTTDPYRPPLDVSNYFALPPQIAARF
jgi:Suppressor of fused protein (SUFU)